MAHLADKGLTQEHYMPNFWIGRSLSYVDDADTAMLNV